MCHRDQHQSPESSSKAREAGYNLCQPSRSNSATSCSVSTTSSTSSTSSSTTPASSKPKKRRWYKRRWYKPKLRFNLHPDWIWVGFIRAGPIEPTGRHQNQTSKEDDEDPDQLPAYSPQDERTRQRNQKSEETSRDRQDDWLIEPPSIDPDQRRRGEGGVEPPPYR